MDMFGAFASSLLSYLLVFFVFVAVIAFAVFLGVTFRKIVDKNKTKTVEKKE